MLKTFDIVQLLTTKRVKFRSGPKGYAATPQGNWVVIGFIDGEALIAREGTIVKAPLIDLRKVGSYNKDEFYRKLATAGYEEDSTINVVETLAAELGIDVSKTRELLLRYNLKTVVDNPAELSQIKQRMKSLLEHKK
jgi:hypothetical protein